jgi:catechol 2,3-dioxygenase-like lactoylglutathione lyase family enzyme
MQDRQFFFSITTNYFDATFAFYSDGLELPVLDQWQSAAGRGALLRAGELGVVELWAAPAGVFLASHQGVGISIEVEDVDDWFGRLRAKGLPVQNEPVAYAWGYRGFSLQDPNGISVSLMQSVEKVQDVTGSRQHRPI